MLLIVSTVEPTNCCTTKVGEMVFSPRRLSVTLSCYLLWRNIMPRTKRVSGYLTLSQEILSKEQTCGADRN